MERASRIQWQIVLSGSRKLGDGPKNDTPTPLAGGSSIVEGGGRRWIGQVVCDPLGVRSRASQIGGRPWYTKSDIVDKNELLGLTTPPSLT